MNRDAAVGRAADVAGSLLVVGLEGPVMSAREATVLRDLEPSGVILFARNVESEAQVLRLTERIRDLADRPLILIDQEGGRVDRLRRLDGRTPSARELARLGRAAVRDLAERTAGRLRRLGVNFNCAPVLDLDEGRDANGIGDRSYGSEPDEVAELAAEVLAAHEAQGVATSLKHFPGLGRTGEDTHEVRPTVHASAADLLARDAVPFRMLLARAPAVMVSHAAFPGLGQGQRPASCCRAVVHDLLRLRMGYDGLAVTDDLEMGAVRDWSPGERAIAAVEAGQDLLLYCSDLEQATQAREALRQAVRAGRLAGDRVLEASGRVAALRRRVG